MRPAQSDVATYFNARSSYWSDVYADADGSCDGVVYRDRMAASLRWIEALGVLPRAHALDVGCGAGVMTVALAARGYLVDAVDVAEEMLAQARAHTVAHDLAPQVQFHHGDVHSLELRESSFDLAVGLGLLPWVPRPGATVRVLARLLKPGGHLLLTADSRWCLSHLLDPGRNPLTRRTAWFGHHLLRRAWPATKARPAPASTPPAFRHSVGEVDGWLAAAGLEKRASASVGFGPFTYFDQELFSAATSMKLHASLQALADRHLPILEEAGAHYLVLAQKPDHRPLPAAGSARCGPRRAEARREDLS